MSSSSSSSTPSSAQQLGTGPGFIQQVLLFIPAIGRSQGFGRPGLHYPSESKIVFDAVIYHEIDCKDIPSRILFTHGSLPSLSFRPRLFRGRLHNTSWLYLLRNRLKYWANNSLSDPGSICEYVFA